MLEEKRDGTLPPRWPPCFVKVDRTSATVRVLLSVMQSTMTAAPPMP